MWFRTPCVTLSLDMGLTTFGPLNPDESSAVGRGGRPGATGVVSGKTRDQRSLRLRQFDRGPSGQAPGRVGLRETRPIDLATGCQTCSPVPRSSVGPSTRRRFTGVSSCSRVARRSSVGPWGRPNDERCRPEGAEERVTLRVRRASRSPLFPGVVGFESVPRGRINRFVAGRISRSGSQWSEAG